MDNVDELLRKKRIYANLKSNINSIISKLNNSIENLEIPSNRVRNVYTIDSASIDLGKINSVREDLITRRNYLKNNVLYKINKELKEIEQKLESVG